jgi:uncharacterized membrane protein
MKINKVTQTLFLLSVVAIILNLARADLWGRINLLYLIWNLFLAWIPYIISLYCIKKTTPVQYFVPLFIFWLLFFPNAPYLVTDVLHIASKISSLLWYDSLLFFFFGWIGLLLGMLSVFHIHEYLKIHLDYLISEIIIFAIFCISSFGIYLGRFERWNSWDLFINPLGLMKHSLYISTNLIDRMTPLMFMGVFTVFMYSVYKTVFILLTSKFE